jgi:hypothetical protein
VDCIPHTRAAMHPEPLRAGTASPLKPASDELLLLRELYPTSNRATSAVLGGTAFLVTLALLLCVARRLKRAA